MRCRDPAPGTPPLHPRRRPLADRRVGLARLVRVRHGSRPVHSRLQPHPRCRQRIVVGLTEALVEQRRHRLVEGEVRCGLARRRRIHAHEARRPRTGRHDDGVRTQSVERDRLALVLDRLDPRSLAQIRACSGRCTEQCLQRQVGVHDPAVGLEEHGLAVFQPEREAALGLGPVQHLERRAARGQRIPVCLPVTKIDRAGLVEQRASPAGLELLPERIRLLRQPHPAFLGIGEANDARPAVTRAVDVSDLELLADHHAPSRPGERPGRGEAHHPGAHDCDLGVGTRLHGRNVALQGVGAGEKL